jgi:phosphatidylserine/phosphatidylglycerophosphate/cardiolipin synthase-like enzyme
MKILFLICCLTTSFANAKHSKPKNEIKRTIQEYLVKAPVDNEVCFSPDELCDIKLEKFVQSAEKSLDIAIFDVTLDKFVHEVLVATKKMPVRIIVDKRQAHGENSLVPTLIKAGAEVRYGHQRGIMHNKFTIVDNKRVETGSFNYTNNASFNNHENQIYLSNPSIVARYREEFDKMWANATLTK